MCLQPLLQEAFRKTWAAKYTLRSHFDGIRSLGFHPTEPVLITASEDQGWNFFFIQIYNFQNLTNIIDS